MSELNKAFKAIEDLGRKRCAERGESWDEAQARLKSQLEAEAIAAKENAAYHAKALAGFAKAIFTPLPKSKVPDEEWAERAYEYRCENPLEERERSGSEEHGSILRTI